ncbi:hypothetical protein Dester_0853 [Desulfurobacterium thermolithotrophum DSM 11699]|uniref:Lipoprotein n=1 Tax=Desulfurobacterium thermolithotrophum (strain DSM 11699 / BSA) TaxID=868864 RepID=F0S3S1_DESTD|nr:hypothetical protein [Desulfurobacterium thermolithotrophum]ADY73493.1 hypothetical protein Dester_0853 [Desulfurobacterium thermolithotrophum DSM 11699]
MKRLSIIALVMLTSCVPKQQSANVNVNSHLESRIEVLELKQSEILKELKGIEEKLNKLKEEIPKLRVSIDNIRQDLSKVEEKFPLIEKSIKETKSYALKLNQNSEQNTEKKLLKLKEEISLQFDSVSKEISTIKKEINASKEDERQKLKELEEKIREIEERLSNLRIPSIKIEEVKPEK